MLARHPLDLLHQAIELFGREEQRTDVSGALLDIATRLDLSGALFGRSPHPSDDLWLRDSDVVLIPKKPIQRFADAIDLYFTQSFYGIFPFEAFVTID